MRLGPYVHANGDGEEIVAIEKAALADAGVQAEIAKLKLPEGSVVVSDPWIYGSPAPFLSSLSSTPFPPTDVWPCRVRRRQRGPVPR